ncbi:hypothetical protein BDW22DRAFT_220096 [Trametopsis cervina]|nr:hypothetical protein BDW22DRAFT_220096 [Trametopsis cervina]
MPPIRTKRMLLESTFSNGPGTLLITYSRQFLVNHPYDIRYRGTAVLEMRVYREMERYAKEAREFEESDRSEASKKEKEQDEISEKKEQVQDRISAKKLLSYSEMVDRVWANRVRRELVPGRGVPLDVPPRIPPPRVIRPRVVSPPSNAPQLTLSEGTKAPSLQRRN